ncbi:iron reductase domain protein [Dothidotthia symphoricarpi CBS 119687]|uniref:Iron reductase domain protein n=1 Tax=Dothidotthia symphoricarpi CBS 119687 TaxID=1392245 RepID=A0A6A6AVA1_9PLEO|nr:iron reductase domain protein [Dothidotthia symphoricarpi CBS 119687]KAF2134777.1 iron reductase domain protein [Dothidotthia symphoricarpi CBS 119687]
MAGPRETVWWLVVLFGFLSTLVQAQNTTAQNTTASVSASTFFLEETETQFSLNIANDSDDVFVYFTSPAYSWVGVGFGDKMEDSLMFVMYPNEEGDSVTISPRIGSKNAEPSFTPSVDVEVLPGTMINDSMFVFQARCSNCRSWLEGSLDVKNEAHPMIYAFGNAHLLQSNSQHANLKRHIRYGHFTMDMVAATGTGGVPTKSNAMNGVKLQGDMTRDHDRSNLAHAIIGCLALFVLWPLNIIFAGFFKNIKIHVGVSIVMLAFLIVAYALGIHTSYEYNRSKGFNTPHQIFAFISLFPMVLLSVLPIRPLATLHKLIPRLHTPLTSILFITLALTGGLGLHLASQTRSIILGYAAVTLFIFVFNTTLQTCVRRRGSAYARATTRRQLGEDDDQDLMLAESMAKRTMEMESRSGSAASLRPQPQWNGGREGGESREFGADGQEMPRSAGRAGVYGGGAMPGPQYMMNMHPGVPVHRW